MTTPLREALDRTMRLMREDLVAEVDDSSLEAALTGTYVVLVGDARNLSSHAAQSAYVTAAILMARSGHRVYLAAPNVPLVGPQPPLREDRLVSGLLEVGSDLLPGVGFSVYPRRDAALSVVFGDSPSRYRARRVIAVNASAWCARLARASNAGPWAERDWPLGAMAAGMLASVEAFKVTMHRLRRFAKDPRFFDALFEFTDQVSLELAPSDAPRSAALGRFDFVSGGAITNATLYVLARLLEVTGYGRIVEPQRANLSNLNRYLLLRRTAIGRLKAEILNALMPPHLELQAIPLLYHGGQMTELGPFAPSVLVGTDDIPVRWDVQLENPGWLGVGATTHWAAMASFHQRGLGCARCLHPRDDPTAGPIPTISFVSFFGGLMLASYLVRTLAGELVSSSEQYIYASPLRPEHIWRSPVAVRADCPMCQFGHAVRVA